MKPEYDYAIVGSGPAGMAAAVRAAACGLQVALIDEQHRPGGQIYRSVEQADPSRLPILGPDYQFGRSLVHRFREASVDYIGGASVWQITPQREIYYLKDANAGCFKARRLLIATGAMERPVPIAGWTLAGVMGAGAVDVLFKSSGLIPDGRVVLAGTGPLLYLVTCHLLQCGISVQALLDTCPVADYLKAARLLPAALPGIRYLLKGLALRSRILKARVPHFQGISNLRASGTEQVNRVSFTCGRRQHVIETDHLILHDGVVPNTQMTRLLECRHTWNPLQHYWRPDLDKWGNSSVPGVAVAGDTGGIYGARSAQLAGELAALDTACSLKAISSQERDRAAAPLRGQLVREMAVRPFLDTLFRPNPDFYRPADDVLVCRCEEITAGQIRQVAAEGGMGPNQVKAKIRCGMGPCQGRMCGLTVAEIIADAYRVPMQQVGYYRVRPPLKSIPLSALANLETCR